jgi:putative membrane protein
MQIVMSMIDTAIGLLPCEPVRMNLKPLAHFAASVAGAVLWLPLALLAADDAKNAGVESGRLSAPDEKFVLDTVQGGMTEVKLGELAKQKAKRSDVKAFGERMIVDHAKANDDLKALAQRKGLTLPEQLDATHAGLIDRLSKLEADQFDKAYIDGMIKDHQKDVEEFEEESRRVSDADLKKFVVKTLPTLKSHLEHIKGVEADKPN